MAKTSLDWMTSRPIAHRGLHNVAEGRIENSLSAVRAAVEHGYGIEVDLHPSKDSIPMVYHDNILDRLTGETGAFRSRDARALQKIKLSGSTDHIPTLAQLLDLVDGKVGLVLELKGIAGEETGFVEGVLDALKAYDGPVAIMSFKHRLLADARKLGTLLPIGLTAEGSDEDYEKHVRAWKEFDIDFVSYGLPDLPNRFVREFRDTGKPVITWTIRSSEQAALSARYGDQITFEGFLA